MEMLYIALIAREGRFFQLISMERLSLGGRRKRAATRLLRYSRRASAGGSAKNGGSDESVEEKDSVLRTGCGDLVDGGALRMSKAIPRECRADAATPDCGWYGLAVG